MPDILLATANARYSRSSLALRYLLANLGEINQNAAIMEFVNNELATEIIERILQESPKVLGLSVYLWNVDLLTEVAALIKELNPRIVVVLGGPEVGCISIPT